ncbi:MAG: hypothetical protein GF329_09555 [Candidatus Lokiarchaeota archaeon]|nr:hypothetical protein [Candidatus Lokiarchaeota archaeon]
MGFLRGFLAVLFGILIVPILSIALMTAYGGPFYIIGWENALTSFDFVEIGKLLAAPVSFDTTTNLLGYMTEGLGIPLMNNWAVTGPGLIEAIGLTSDLTLFIYYNTWKMVVWIFVGGFVGTIMSKATKGLLIALGIWIAWFVWNLLFAWILIPIIGGSTMTIIDNILPFLMNSILPLALVIVSGAIGGAITKTEIF